MVLHSTLVSGRLSYLFRERSVFIISPVSVPPTLLRFEKTSPRYQVTHVLSSTKVRIVYSETVDRCHIGGVKRFEGFTGRIYGRQLLQLCRDLCVYYGSLINNLLTPFGYL